MITSVQTIKNFTAKIVPISDICGNNAPLKEPIKRDNIRDPKCIFNANAHILAYPVNQCEIVRVNSLSIFIWQKPFCM